MTRSTAVRRYASTAIMSIALMAGAFAGYAQERVVPSTPASPSPASAAAPASAPAAGAPASSFAVSPDDMAVPRSFRGIELGMSMDEVKSILSSDGMFSYRGAPDVSLLPRPDESLIEVSGLSYVRRAFFQFYEGKLFVMIYALNEKEMDHYSVFTSLSIKYGKPDSLSPSESVWTDGVTRMSVERPLAVKYIDLAVFDALKAAGSAQQSYEEILRTEFLGSF